MKYDRFESLPVWQAAITLAQRVFHITEKHNVCFRGCGDVCNQLQRAVVSISNNIAEGFERGTTNELLAFLYTARGSAGEVRSMLHLLDRLPRFSDLKSQISDLKSQSESISRQLRGWADSLQNSDIRGQRHLNDAVRADFDRKTRRDAFWAQLEQLSPPLKSQISNSKSETSDLNSPA